MDQTAIQEIVFADSLDNGTWSCNQFGCRKKAKYVWIRRQPMTTRYSGLCEYCANDVVQSTQVPLPELDS